MVSRGDLISLYERRMVEYSILKETIDGILQTYAANKHFLYSSRLKDRDSYLQKLETGRFGSADIDDLLACSLVVPRMPQIRPCIDGIPPAITVELERGPSTRQKEPNIFRYDDWQLICRLNPPPGAPIAGSYQRPFELQVRTLAQFAWAVATHPVVYKGEVVDWRRERLSAQLRAGAEQADLLYAAFVDIAPRVPAGHSSRSDALTHVGRQVTSWLDQGLMPKEFRPASLVRLAESVVEFCGRTGERPQVLTRRVHDYLSRNAYPVSLTPYQLFVGVLLSTRRKPVEWASIEPGFTILVTTELEDAFPECRAIPVEYRVGLPS